MKFSNPVFILLFLSFFFSTILTDNRPIIRHQEEQWSVGTLAPKLKVDSTPLTDRYEEMIKNHDKKMISLGLNNSGLINLNDTIVISDNAKYMYEDGVTGKLSPQTSPKKSIITDNYKEMLVDKNKRLISMEVNRTAFYDPDNQVVVKGTGNMPEIDPFDNHYLDKMESPQIVKVKKENKKQKFLKKETNPKN